jgi:SAM-dependent methyltransferase
VPVHRAALGFHGSARAYERGRPHYPEAAVAGLCAALGIGPGATVVDLAAGTGKLTRQLVPAGARLVAVEPVAGMRAELADAVPGVPVVAGVAEALPLRAGSAAGIVVAQAFHWFDPGPALAEIHRVLGPGGRLGLVWNVRDRTVDWVARVADITEEYAPEMPRYRTGRWREGLEASPLFGPLEGATYPHEHEVDAPTMVDRVASISWIAILPDAERGRALERVRRALDGLPERFPVPYHTDVWWCEAVRR